MESIGNLSLTFFSSDMTKIIPMEKSRATDSGRRSKSRPERSDHNFDSLSQKQSNCETTQPEEKKDDVGKAVDTKKALRGGVSFYFLLRGELRVLLFCSSLWVFFCTTT